MALGLTLQGLCCLRALIVPISITGRHPEWRGQGLSKVVMNFVRDMAIEIEIEGLSLAVDLRNTRAIRLYQSFGFVTQRFVQAWIYFPK